MDLYPLRIEFFSCVPQPSRNAARVLWIHIVQQRCLQGCTEHALQGWSSLQCLSGAVLCSCLIWWEEQAGCAQQLTCTNCTTAISEQLLASSYKLLLPHAVVLCLPEKSIFVHLGQVYPCWPDRLWELLKGYRHCCAFHKIEIPTLVWNLYNTLQSAQQSGWSMFTGFF